MPQSIAPVKTVEGQEEVTSRRRRLTQRHRTVLLLVDGRRSVDAVLRLAAQAGVPPECFDELVRQGLVEVKPAARVRSTITPTRSSASAPLEEARKLLLREVRTHAPVTGSLTLMKLKRAATREALERLLDEVEQRLRKPRRQIIAAHTMRHVRHLLSLPVPDMA